MQTIRLSKIDSDPIVFRVFVLTPFALGVFRNEMEVRNEFLKSDRASKIGNNSKSDTDSQLKKTFSRVSKLEC